MRVGGTSASTRIATVTPSQGMTGSSVGARYPCRTELAVTAV